MVSSIDIIPHDSRLQEFQAHHGPPVDSGGGDSFARQLVRARDEQSARDSNARAADDTRKASPGDTSPAESPPSTVSESKDLPATKVPTPLPRAEAEKAEKAVKAALPRI